MIPIKNSFELFNRKLSCNQDLCEGHTIGLLFVDSAQPSVEAYITNYLNHFNRASGKYIDFYLPGYLERNNHSAKSININGMYWDFDRADYETFQNEMKELYGIPFSTTAYLLLIEMVPNKEFKNKIKIELDKGKNDPKDTGDFFYNLFEFAKSGNEFKRIKEWMDLNKTKKILKSTFITLVKTKLMVDIEELETYSLL